MDTKYAGQISFLLNSSPTSKVGLGLAQICESLLHVKSSSFSSYSQCHLALVIMSVLSRLSRVLSIISSKDVPQYNDVKLYSIISLSLSLPLFSSNFTVVTPYSVFPPLFMTWPKNVDGFFFFLLTSCPKMWRQKIYDF